MDARKVALRESGAFRYVAKRTVSEKITLFPIFCLHVLSARLGKVRFYFSLTDELNKL